MKALFFSLFTVVFAVGSATAQPVVNSVSGSWGQGAPLTISGSGFGTKSPAKPFLWADFSNTPASPLGVKTAWDELGNMAVSGDCPGQPAGASCLAAIDGSGSWAAGSTHTAWNAPGQKTYIYRLSRKNFAIQDHSQNWKHFRLWPSTYGTPDMYMAESHGLVTLEAPNYTPVIYHDLARMAANTWYQEEIIFKANDTIDLLDGSFDYRMDGKQVNGAAKPWIMRVSTTSKLMELIYPVHGVKANSSNWTPTPWRDSNRMWADDVYVDTTWARVMVGNASTYTACTRLVPQIPTAWSNSSITVSGHIGALRHVLTPYLYVIDAQGRMNSAGIPLNASSGGSTVPQPPTAVHIVR